MVARGCDKGVGVSGIFEMVEDEVGGKAFRNTAEVELHSLIFNSDRLIFGAEFEQVDATASAGFGNGGGRWKVANATGFTPEMGERAKSGVEEPVALVGYFFG